MEKDFSNKKGSIAADMVATTQRISSLISDSGNSDKKLGEQMGLIAQTINKWRHGNDIPDTENLFIKISSIKFM